ncbi:MAG: hypothetical protein MJ209_00250 [archaeon]|nr:hypothetical protein [archaeon]
MDVKDKNDLLPIDIENISMGLTTNQQTNIFLFDDKDSQVNVFPDNRTLIVNFDGHIQVSYGANPANVCVGFKEYTDNLKPGDNIENAKLKFVRPELLHDVRLCFNDPISIDVVIAALTKARVILQHRNKASND